MKNDYADRSSLLNGGLDDLEDHWHREDFEAKKGRFVASVITFVFAVLLVIAYSKNSPAAVNTVSCYSLVDQAGEE